MQIRLGYSSHSDAGACDNLGAMPKSRGLRPAKLTYTLKSCTIEHLATTLVSSRTAGRNQKHKLNPKCIQSLEAFHPTSTFETQHKSEP